MEKIATVLTPEGSIGRLSVIELEGALWLVAGWMTHNTKPLKRPTRLIRLTGLRFQTADPTAHGADYLVEEPIPKAVLDGPLSPETAGKFVVWDKPNIELPAPKPN